MDGARELTFGTLGERKVAFSEAQQKLFELNNSAAYLWRHLSMGAKPEAIVAELIGAGIPRDIASDHVSQALNNWRRLGLRLPSSATRLVRAGEAKLLSQTIVIGGLSIVLRYSTPLIARVVRPVFEHLERTKAAHDLMIDIAAEGGRVSIVRAGERLALCSERETVPTLKAELTKVVLERSVYAVALHTACLARNGRLLLVSGPNGAGKTALSVALACAGFRFGGDDIALLDVQGNAIGVTFAPALKQGAWKLLDKLRPELGMAPVFRRPDGRRVRYLKPLGRAMSTPRPVGWLVVLRRRTNMAAKLLPIDPLMAMRRLLAGAFAPSESLTVDGFQALAGTINRAHCYELAYSSLGSAVELLTEACS